MGNELKVYENLVEMTHIYHEMLSAGLIKPPDEIVSENSTVSGYDELRSDIIIWAKEFEEKFPDTEEYLTDIREFAEAKFIDAYGTALGREKRRADRVMAKMKKIDWTLFLRQKTWLSRQISELTPSGTEATELPEGILNMMDALQDAWEGEGKEGARTVWEEFKTVPFDPLTKCIKKDWRCFRKGTNYRDIVEWFGQFYGFKIYELYH